MNLIFRKIFLLSLTLLFSFAIDANIQIADSLKQDASAVVLNYSAKFVQNDVTSATYDITEEIVILNKKGIKFGNFIFWGDRFRELKSFSGVIKDASGNIIRKIKKGDLTVSTQSDMSTIASDSHYAYFDCNAPSYPYTVEFTYQEKFKGGIISYPSFMPATSYDIAVENASYTLELPSDIDLRYKANYESNIKKENIDGKNVYTMSVQNMKAIPYEPFAPSYREILPRVIVAPGYFCYDSQCGNMSTWAQYGAWVSDLLAGRDSLKPEAIEELKTLTQNAKDDKEKVKILYEYMQANSRYVSIQLGIGGFQPIEAEKVAKSNFGDCKGLSNWMKAMLKAVDINSNYCEISTREDVLYPDFSNVSQTNHAILMVPLSNDTVWLECTSQTLPFGYVHTGIAGHDALVIKEDLKQGVVCKLPIYNNNENQSGARVYIELGEDGKAKGQATFTESLQGYENNYISFRSNDRKKHIDYISTFLKAPNISYSTIQTSEDRSEQPSCRLDVDFTSSEFVSKTGSRIFLPLCPLYKGGMLFFSAEKREHDIQLPYGHTETDTVEYVLPASYSIEDMPKAVDITCPLGRFISTTTVNDNKITYSQKLELYKGTYSKDEYKSIKDFFATVSGTLRKRLVLKKVEKTA